MRGTIEVDPTRPTRARVTLPDGREVVMRIVVDPDHGACLALEAERGIAILPRAGNAVLIAPTGGVRA